MNRNSTETVQCLLFILVCVFEVLLFEDISLRVVLSFFKPRGLNDAIVIISLMYYGPFICVVLLNNYLMNKAIGGGSFWGKIIVFISLLIIFSNIQELLDWYDTYLNRWLSLVIIAILYVSIFKITKEMAMS